MFNRRPYTEFLTVPLCFIMILSIGIGVYATGPVVKPGAFRTLDVAHATDRIGVEHADPAVINLARRAGILSRNTT